MLNLFSRLSLRANIVAAAMACLLLVLVACGDDDSSFAPRDSEDSSSSICEDCDDSSSSVKSSSSAKSSSSRHCEDCKDEAISSGKDDVKSSSSVCEYSSSSRHCEDCKDEAISSSSSVESSSSKVGCKTETEDNCEYGELLDTRDGQTYKTVKIGDQVWMAENLNFETENSWCGGGKDSTEGDCSKYGRLYRWPAAVGKSEEECGYGFTCGLSGMVRGVCPEGWLLPDTTEWSKLFTAVGGKYEAGDILKSQTGWNDYNGTSGNGTDTFGFSAFPAGFRLDNGKFPNEGINALFWSATEYDSDDAHGMDLDYGSEKAYLNDYYKDNAFSVRCLKDDP
jgi:Fibrobacter succinogenes major domain (Fib_succ_major).